MKKKEAKRERETYTFQLRVRLDEGSQKRDLQVSQHLKNVTREEAK